MLTCLSYTVLYIKLSHPQPLTVNFMLFPMGDLHSQLFHVAIMRDKGYCLVPLEFRCFAFTYKYYTQ